MSNISIIIQREFNERVRKKSFIITTLLMPVLMIALMAAPALIMQFSRGDEKRIAVIDESGLVAPRLESDEELRFEPTDLTTEEARRTLTDRFGVLRIGGDILENPSDVKLYANSSSSLSVESSITDQIERILEAEKLKRYNIDNLQQILDEVKTTVTLQTFRNDKSQEEETHAQSSTVATVTGYVLGFILYMFLLIYGQMVMQSVIEEKNNRVLEVMVSSVRPFDLMMGKILGIASVAVVQVAIWGVLICGIGAAVMPHLMPSDVMASAQAMQQVSALSSPRDQEYIVESYEDGQRLRNRYSVTAYSQDRIVLRQEESQQEQEEGEFLLKVENDYITVYTKKDSQVYEYTNIPLDALPEEMKREVLLGKTLKGEDELYSFLENYSS